MGHLGLDQRKQLVWLVVHVPLHWRQDQPAALGLVVAGDATVFHEEATIMLFLSRYLSNRLSTGSWSTSRNASMDKGGMSMCYWRTWIFSGSWNSDREFSNKDFW